MGDDLFLTPEITMHEEPGEIRINQSGVVDVEIDDEGPSVQMSKAGYPFGPGEIPPEISITKVNKNLVGPAKGNANGNGYGGDQNYLKVRNDLMGIPRNITPPGNQRQVRPPPLLRIGNQGGLPPMPRLKFGGPSRPRPPPQHLSNPLAGMINMMPPVHGMPRHQMGANGKFEQRPHLEQQISPHFMLANGIGNQAINSMAGMARPAGPANMSTASILRQQRLPHVRQNMEKQQQMAAEATAAHQRKSEPSPLSQLQRQLMSTPTTSPKPSTIMTKPKTMPQFINPGGKTRSTAPGKVGVEGLKNLSSLKMPPGKPAGMRPVHSIRNISPIQGHRLSASDNGTKQQIINTIQNVSPAPKDRVFPELDITVRTVPKKTAAAISRPSPPKLDEIDDLEKLVEGELEELDDVEPDEMFPHPAGSSMTINDEIVDSPSGVNGNVEEPKIDPPPPKVEKMQFVRRADGKGFVRKMVGQKRVSNTLRKKMKRRPFRGANYRFDGSAIKKVKRAVKRSLSTAGTTGDREDKDPAFFAYLGIQRKDSTDSNQQDAASAADSVGSAESEKRVSSVGPKAKKSFKANGSSLRRLSLNNVVSDLPVKRKVGVYESGLAFLSKKPKMDKSSPGSKILFKYLEKGEKDGKDDCPISSSEQTPLGSLDSTEDSGENLIDNGQQPLLPRRAKQAATEANASVFSAGAKADQNVPLQKCICLCNNDQDLISVTQKPGVTYSCQAIESVGGSRVGCRNKVTEFKLRKTSVTSGGKLYCSRHIERLRNHQACGLCGEFCAHGIFMMCRPSNKAGSHMFHRNCFLQDNKKQCPHCECTEKPIAVQLKLQMNRMPLNLLQSVSRMTFPKNKTRNKSELILKSTAAVTYKMPDGQIISSECLPSGVSDEALSKVIEALEDKDKLKHITRNMYVPTKAGDNVRLVRLLSLGYSPKQRFNEVEGGTPLHVAATEGHVLTVHILVQAGAELDALDDEQNTALMLACNQGKPEVVKYLLQAGADMTLKGDDGMTCLHLATQNGHLECVHAIMNQNNMPRKFLNLQDEGGWTPLVWACENKHEEVIRYLLMRGADPFITDAEGNIAIHWAALSGSRSTCELLFNYGCPVNATNGLGETPMHIALRQDHYECAVLFLMRGANLNIKNKSGQLPAEIMTGKDSKCKTIVKLTTLLQSLMKDTKQHYFERIVTNDITKGKETLPIQCVNDLDDEGVPTNYVYVKNNCVTSNIPIDRSIGTLQHCKCNDKCSSEDSCNCSDLSVKSWYDDEGRLKEDFDFNEPPMIFECNQMCRCNVSTCHNRVLQHGITARLQVFRAYGMGWGVRAAHVIPKGSFVCEYVGEIISDSEAETREDSYLFDLESRDGDTFCIDANRYRNIAGLINHLCTPNLTPVKVFSDHQDLRFPHIALFANREIKKGEELGFDYGEKFWVIKHEQFTCHCTSDKCRYNKSNIHSFLKEYYRKLGEPMPEDLMKPPSGAAAKATQPVQAPSAVEKSNAANAEIESATVKKDETKTTETEMKSENQDEKNQEKDGDVPLEKTNENPTPRSARNSKTKEPDTTKETQSKEAAGPNTRKSMTAKTPGVIKKEESHASSRPKRMTRKVLEDGKQQKST